MSVLGDSFAPVGHSASITTGQGEDSPGNWMARGLGQQSMNRLGNNRAPPPTCNIPISRGNKHMVPITNELSWVPKIAESLMVEPGCPIPKSSMSSGPAANLASGSIESTQDTIQLSNGARPQPSEEAEEGSQQDLTDASEDEEELLDAKARRPAYKRGRKGKEKKKVGRPIAYRGDPNAPELTDQERRRIKRRIANRESARRVRHKRQEELEDMQIKMEQIQAHNSHLQQHAAHTKHQKDVLTSHLEELERKYEKVTVENKQLAIEIQALRQSLQLKMSALEEELDKRANEAEGTAFQTAFANPIVQSQPLCLHPPAQPSLMSPLPLGSKHCPSVPLDWLPSLNLDDFRAMDVVNPFFDDAPHPGKGIKRETVNENSHY